MLLLLGDHTLGITGLASSACFSSHPPPSSTDNLVEVCSVSCVAYYNCSLVLLFLLLE
uniref:Macaca fascicularis brain cDNA, clone: QflA-23430 n=1 Tax=Macaca fascicularis TaxID=9541 RepID=I7GDQ9_MACFA|nr:unnamed protein product [Macaca fascicularis]